MVNNVRVTVVLVLGYMRRTYYPTTHLNSLRVEGGGGDEPGQGVLLALPVGLHTIVY